MTKLPVCCLCLQVREVRCHYSTATGPCAARSMAQQLWAGEEYVLQIDAHMRFVQVSHLMGVFLTWREGCAKSVASTCAALLGSASTSTCDTLLLNLWAMLHSGVCYVCRIGTSCAFVSFTQHSRPLVTFLWCCPLTHWGMTARGQQQLCRMLPQLQCCALRSLTKQAC